MDAELVKILEHSLQLFEQYGVKAVTMDQVSAACGISKKTLYKYVSNKEDLMLQTFQRVELMIKAQMEQFVELDQNNAIDKLFALEQFAKSHLREGLHSLIVQLDQYYPAVAHEMKVRRENIMFTFTKKNLREGIREGLYRQDLHVDHITLLYYGHVLATHDNFVSASFDTDELRKTSLLYHIRGIASPKGLEYLNTLIND